ITTGDYKGQARDINGTTKEGTVTPHLNFSGVIVEGTEFVITAIRVVPAEVAALVAAVATADAKVSYTEDIASGNSGGDGAWHDALDVDTRGMKSMSAVVTNIDGANSLNWRIRARPSDYTSGTDEEIPECPGSETLAPAELGLLELVKAYSRVKIQVQDTVPASAADYTINYLINR
ncbi:unnamed protein product, partial [marine sediment metagenome]